MAETACIVPCVLRVGTRGAAGAFAGGRHQKIERIAFEVPPSSGRPAPRAGSPRRPPHGIGVARRFDAPGEPSGLLQVRRHHGRQRQQAFRHGLDRPRAGLSPDVAASTGSSTILRACRCETRADALDDRGVRQHAYLHGVDPDIRERASISAATKSRAERTAVTPRVFCAVQRGYRRHAVTERAEGLEGRPVPARRRIGAGDGQDLRNGVHPAGRSSAMILPSFGRLPLSTISTCRAAW